LLGFPNRFLAVRDKRRNVAIIGVYGGLHMPKRKPLCQLALSLDSEESIPARE